MCQNDVFDGHGVKIDILDINNFLKIKETLERIGISTQDKTLYQSCHILHKKDLNGESKYAIVHFKEMFIFDGKRSSLTKEDTQILVNMYNLTELNLSNTHIKDDVLDVLFEKLGTRNNIRKLVLMM